MGWNDASMKTQYAGTCKVNPSHTWKVGDEIFYQKDPKIVCSNKECFENQKGDIQHADHSNYFISKPQGRTNEERMTDARIMLEYCWKLAKDKAANENLADSKERLILAEVLYKGIIEDWCR